MIERAIARFEERYDGKAVAGGIAPGRVEVLGNHTDYNGGSVLTAAVDRFAVAVGRPVPEDRVRVYAANLERETTFGLAELKPDVNPDWSSYVKSVFGVLHDAGAPCGGMDLVLVSDIPIGAGLSSSAAIEAAVARLILQVYPYPMDSLTLAQALQRGENEYARVRCGLLDQFSSIHGQRDGLVLLDCATGSHETLSLGAAPPAMVVIDSRVSRELGRNAPYNVRRDECETARAHLSGFLERPLGALCEASLAELDEAGDDIPEPARSRARHVLGEDARVRAAGEALRTGNVVQVGELMNDSHRSSQANFENSIPALDRLCELAANLPGCLGSRLCGAGWGGCTINLVEAGEVASFADGFSRVVQEWPPPRPEIHVCFASDGARGQDL